MTSLEFTGEVHHGHLPPPMRMGIKTALERMEGKSITVKISRARKQRSKNQNDYYWGVVVPKAKEVFLLAGDIVGDDYAHEFMKMELGGMKVISNLTGQWIPTSSTEASTISWEEWMTNIRKWAAENGVQIPEPNEAI